MKEMTAKERVQAFFAHKPMDKFPSEDGLHVLFDAEAYAERPPHLTGGKDWFGVEWKYEEGIGAIAPDHSQEPILEDICDWKEIVKFPDLDAWDWSKVEEIDHISEIDRENKVFEMMFVNGPFERLHMLMGFENALCAMLMDPEEVTAFFDAFMEWKLKLMDKVVELYKPDVLMFHDDWGTQHSMFFSPEMWRELLKPQIKKAVDHAHELGVIFEMHSCGFIEPIVPDFVELGIDSWQGMEINDIAALKKITGDKLSYHTTPDYQKYHTEELSGTFDEASVRERVRETFLANAEGYCYMPMFLPFGGHAKDIMIDEVAKCSETVY